MLMRRSKLPSSRYLVLWAATDDLFHRTIGQAPVSVGSTRVGLGFMAGWLFGELLRALGVI